MATYSATIGRITGTGPAWRAAMTNTDRVYYVGSTPSWYAPALSLPSRFGRAGTAPDNFGAGWDVMSGYSSGELLHDVGGSFGTMVFGTGGHTLLANQILGFDLNQDDPGWSWWHPPTWKTSDTGGANLYYSPAEEAALVAGPRGTAARIRPGFEPTDAPLWDRRFPVAYAGWIFPRKLTTGQMGDNVPHGFRYGSTHYLPASLTGADSMFFTITGAQGPFDQAAMPATVTLAEWFDPSALVSNSQRRFPYYFRNTRTGAWTMRQWQPDGMNVGGYSSPCIGSFRDTKRVYVVGGWANSQRYYYLDFKDGMAAHTVSPSFSGHLNIHGFCSGAFSDGDALGRHFMVTLSNEEAHTRKLVIYDFDSNTSFRIDLAAFGFSYSSTDERVGISYDAANRRVLLLMAPSGQEDTPFYWSISVPSTLTDASGWVASKRFLTFNDPAMATSIFKPGQSSTNALAGFYNKTRLHPTLGVILIPSADFRMTGFVPSV